ncbi:MAG: N-acetyltransferase [Bryobacteraceae bacterium]|nr:N-acetyltransferase [Bryobacteraceae bacterium]
MARLIQEYAETAIMLPRNEFELAEHVRDFTVAFNEQGELTGCGALHIYTPTVAEVRSLGVNPQLKTQGIGRRIVEALVTEGEQLGLHSIFAFTYVPGFFHKLGFDLVDRSELPLKAWKDCLRCPKLQACDEISVIRRLSHALVTPPIPPIQGEPFALYPEPRITLPVMKQKI